MVLISPSDMASYMSNETICGPTAVDDICITGGLMTVAEWEETKQFKGPVIATLKNMSENHFAMRIPDYIFT